MHQFHDFQLPSVKLGMIEHKVLGMVNKSLHLYARAKWAILTWMFARSSTGPFRSRRSDLKMDNRDW